MLTSYPFCKLFNPGLSKPFHEAIVTFSLFSVNKIYLWKSGPKFLISSKEVVKVTLLLNTITQFGNQPTQVWLPHASGGRRGRPCS